MDQGEPAQDPKPPCIDEIEFERAADLIAALRPAFQLWQPNPAKWIFRGHADASWKLLPSANRRKSLRPFTAKDFGPVDAVYCEPTVGDLVRLLQDFATTLDAAGREIPGDGSVPESLSKYPYLRGLFDEVYEPLTALGQHNGLPTMLLDWTRVGTYAAYFAASDVAALERDNLEGSLCVWALHRDVHDRGGQIGEYGSRVRVIEPLRAGNANLHAQGGVFTLAYPPIADTRKESVITLVTVDDVVRAICRTGEVPGTLMRRLSLPRREAPEVLRWLAHEGVAATALFPGLDGVVRSVRDRRHERSAS